MTEIKPLAIYLPQFHTIPENDKAWGVGFTEWINVRKAKPMFDGHYQPHIPHNNVGYYDLRNSEVLIQQAALAKEYGIYGFAFYHYWFNGKRLLETPLDKMLKTGTPDFPFCYIWANENWTKRWDGREGEVIIQQDYSSMDDENHIRFLCEKVFSDYRYIKVDNKPVFIVYRTELLPEIIKTSAIWNEIAKEYGFGGIYLIRVESFVSDIDPSAIGFDASMEFQPNWNNMPDRLTGSINDKLLEMLHIKVNPSQRHKIFSYKDLVEKNISFPKKSKYKCYPGITPMWDNSARRKIDATIFKDSSPYLYEKWLKEIVAKFQTYSESESFLFINAWNEWAEGCHLEPCSKWGKGYLEATKKALNMNGCNE